ncbi:MAG TPA: hypothetical protein VEH52_13745 [Gaiellaceae bacterium]|nr:hypothetical protein [Gaiellaceae bacterium]
MGLRDVLSGRKKLPQPKAERLFALTTAAVTLQTECNLTTAGAGGICFKPLSAGAFDRAADDLEQLLDGIAHDSGSKLDRSEDSFGFSWIVVHDPQLEDQVATVHAVAQGFEEQGFGDRLLGAAFRFQHPLSADGDDPVFFVYGYKTGTFWPFVPTGKDHTRDNAQELELKAKLESELPIEPDLSRWFGLFDAPL